MTLPAPPPSPLEAGIEASFLRRTAPELARDIVLQIDSASNLAASYGLTPVQWASLRASPAFRQMISAAMEELAGPVGVSERVRRQARLVLAECGVLDMAALMGDPKVSAGHRVQAFSELKEVAGLSAKTASSVGGGGGFGGPLIQINFPDGRQFGITVDQPASGEDTSE